MTYNNYSKITLIGALTSKPYAFTARSWELKSTQTIDLFDSLGSNIRVDVKGLNIMRILPINNDFVNEEWISDKARHAFDGLSRNRFITPMIKINNVFQKNTWLEILKNLENNFSKNEYDNIIVNTGNFTDLEHLTTIDVLTKLNNKLIVNNQWGNVNADFQKYYTIDNSIFNITGKKVYILVGINSKLENPILNIRLKKLSQTNSALVAYIGPKISSNLNAIHLGTNVSILKNILKGKHPFCTTIQTFLKKNAKSEKIQNSFKNNIEIIFGNDFNQIQNANTLFPLLNQFTISHFKFNIGVLELYSGKINALELGLFTTINKSTLRGKNLYYLLDTEYTKNIKKDDFVIFQGTHNTKLLNKLNIILPATNWVEKSSLYLNCFGHIQKSNTVIAAPNTTRVDWKITNIFALLLSATKNASNTLRKHNNVNLNHIDKVHIRLNELVGNIMANIGNYTTNQNLNIFFKKTLINPQLIQNTFLKSFISNYYHTNNIDKNSKIMKECTKLINNKKTNFTK